MREMHDKAKNAHVYLGKNRFSFYNFLIFALIFGVMGGFMLYKSFAAPPPKNPPTTTVPLSFTQNWSNDPGKYIANHGCFGVDNQATWNGYGTLAPGETYTFKPQYPTCPFMELPVIAMNVTWSGNTEVKLETISPFASARVDGAQNRPTHVNQNIVGNVSTAYNNQKQANLCLWVDGHTTQWAQGWMDPNTPQTWENTRPIDWTMTITNTGSQPANISASGYERNGWIMHMVPGCYSADGDGDYWNDLLEMSMLELTANASTPEGSENHENIFMASSYMDSKNTTATVDDEIEASPADFNDDSKIDQSDVDMVEDFVGQGDGFSLDQISPNSSEPSHFYKVNKEFRRYDLDGDGNVTQHDVDWVKALVGSPIPMTSDMLDPWAALKTPSTVPANRSQYLYAYAMDNDVITHVGMYSKEGNRTKLLCETWTNQYQFSFFLPAADRNYFGCPWTTPRSGRTATLIVKAYDAAGRSYTAEKTVTAQ